MPCCTFVQLKSICILALDIDILQLLVSVVGPFYFFFAVSYAYRLFLSGKVKKFHHFSLKWAIAC
jgi:hypothetical protein